MDDRGPESGWGRGTEYLALGLKFAGGVVLFTLGGYALDRWLGTTPLFILVGCFGGVTLSSISVYRDLTREEAKERGERR
jgi:F0F1-type ATP synthase assembly protein I